jgi:type IV pilus assembly protein PilO
MGTFSDLSEIKQWGALLLAGVILTAALYFTVFKSQRDQNTQAQQQVETKLHENAELEAYRPKLAEMERQVASLKQQLDIERRIVPDEKQADDFIRAIMAEAAKAGVEVRRFTARPTSSKDFYSELPFEVEVDGPYYSMLNFFDRVGKLERIVNVSNLLVATTRKPSEAKAKRSYQYAPGESVVSTCVATTFFSHDIAPPVPGKPGQVVRN